MNATQAIIDSGFDYNMWMICDVVFENGEYDLVNDEYRYYADCAQQIEAFFHDEACGIDEGDELYSIIRSGEVDWYELGRMYGWDRWNDEVLTIKTTEAQSC
jgi:hypothetical protein